MKKEKAELVRSKLEETLKKFWTNTIQIQANLPPGWRLYKIDASNDMHCYLKLVVSPKRDEFTFEIAWSPNEIIPLYPTSNPADEPTNGYVCFRVGSLIGAKHGDYWWHISGLKDLEAVVDKAAEVIRIYVLPYFEEVKTRQRGNP